MESVSTFLHVYALVAIMLIMWQAVGDAMLCRHISCACILPCLVVLNVFGLLPVVPSSW